MERSLGIVVPAYDPDVDRLATYLRTLADLEPVAIRVELDDPDGSVRERLRDALGGDADDVPATVHAVDDRRGKGAAITAGFEALSTDVYAFVDADGSTPEASLRDVVGPVLAGDAALAVGSRRHPEAAVSNTQSRIRETLGNAFAWLGRRALPVALYDYQCGAKAVDADAWRQLRGDLYEAGFGWDVNLVAAAGSRGIAVEEVPVEWIDRPGSTVAPVGTTASLARALLRVQIRRRLGGPTPRAVLDRLAERE